MPFKEFQFIIENWHKHCLQCSGTNDVIFVTTATKCLYVCLREVIRRHSAKVLNTRVCNFSVAMATDL